MGFLDVFKKIADTAIKDAVEAVTNGSDNKAVSKTSDTASNTAKDNILATGNVPPKPSYKYNDDFADKEYSFMISRDYIEFDSACEIQPSFQYEPFSNEDYAVFDKTRPCIGIGPYDDIYLAVEEFEKSGNLPDGDYEICNSPYFAFRCKFEDRFYKYYAYAFRTDTAREREMLHVCYPPEIKGTQLEKKLISALDEVASTYEEH